LVLRNIALNCKWIISCELQVGKTARIADVEEKFLRKWRGTEHRLDSRCGELESLCQSGSHSFQVFVPFLIFCYPSLRFNLTYKMFYQTQVIRLYN